MWVTLYMMQNAYEKVWSITNDFAKILSLLVISFDKIAAL